MEDTAALLAGDWWVSAGTALGLERDGGFIPWDTDIDIGLRGNWDNPVGDDLLPWPLIGAQYWHGRPTQLAYLHGKLPVDIYVFYPDGDWLVNRTVAGRIAKPARYVETLQPIEGWPAPSPIVDYLEWRYGPNWKIPKGFKGRWEDDAACLQP